MPTAEIAPSGTFARAAERDVGETSSVAATLLLAALSLAIAGLAALGVFAVWSGITVLWSIAPDQTWLELNGPSPTC